MIVPFQSDARYVRFLAALPGLWVEVGALDDPGFLDRLQRERTALGLAEVCLDLKLPKRRSRISRRIAR